MNSRGRLIVISGPSGVGKGTVLSRYLDGREGIRLSVSATTRSPRPGEKDGEQYYFLTQEEFTAKIEGNGMLEWAQYNNHYYGTPRDYVERSLDEGEDVILEIEVQGALQVKALMPEAILIFIMPPSFGELHRRLAGRGTENPEALERRLQAARRELERAPEYDFIVVNDTVEHAVRTLEAVIEGGRNLVKYNLEFIAEVTKDAETYFVAN